MKIEHKKYKMKVKMLKDAIFFGKKTKKEHLFICGQEFFFVNNDVSDAHLNISVYGDTFRLCKELEGVYYKVIEEENDKVNHPKHYTAGKYEVIDVITDRVDRLTGTESYYTSNILKYMYRYDLKNGVEDVRKAKFYLEKLIEHLEK